MKLSVICEFNGGASDQRGAAVGGRVLRTSLPGTDGLLTGHPLRLDYRWSLLI